MIYGGGGGNANTVTPVKVDSSPASPVSVAGPTVGVSNGEEVKNSSSPALDKMQHEVNEKRFYENVRVLGNVMINDSNQDMRQNGAGSTLPSVSKLGIGEDAYGKNNKVSGASDVGSANRQFSITSPKKTTPYFKSVMISEVCRSFLTWLTFSLGAVT